MIYNIKLEFECGHTGERPTHESVIPAVGEQRVCIKCQHTRKVVKVSTDQ